MPVVGENEAEEPSPAKIGFLSAIENCFGLEMEIHRPCIPKRILRVVVARRWESRALWIARLGNELGFVNWLKDMWGRAELVPL